MALEAMPFLGERLRMWGWSGIALSCGGITLITLSQSTGFHIDIWTILILTAAIAQSLYSVGQKPLLTRYTPFECTAYAIWSGTIFLLIFSPGLIGDLRIAPLHVTLAVIYLGIFPGALGYVSWAYALSRLPASTAASFLYLVPIVAIGIAWIWLGELPTFWWSSVVHSSLQESFLSIRGDEKSWVRRPSQDISPLWRGLLDLRFFIAKIIENIDR